jgi:L-fuconolactonase
VGGAIVVTALRVVDAHVHFWDPARLRYPWLDDVPELRRAFLPPDYPRADVVASVFVEANCDSAETLDEVRFVDQLAASTPAIAGIVAFVNLRDVRARTDTLERLDDCKLVVGVRHNIQGQQPGFCLDAEFVRGVQALGRRGLTFDICITAGQLDDVERLVALCPDVSFILDHAGKPAIRDDASASWADGIRRLARHDNVACKLSGLFTEARADQRTDEVVGPYAQHALRCFGITRMLYGSDWPVVTLGGGLEAWRALTDRFTASWSVADRQAFYADNAIRLYGLRLHANA